MIRELHIADLVEAVLHATAQIAFADLHVIEVPVDLDVRRSDLAADVHGVDRAVETVTLVVHADVHRLEDQHHVVRFRDRSHALQRDDDLLVHRFLADTGDVVAGDDRGLLGAQLVRDLARGLDLLLDGVVVLRIVHAGREAPRRELRALDTELAGQVRDRVDVLAAVRPHLEGWEAHRGGGSDAIQERQTSPPHLDVGRELGVLGPAGLSDGTILDHGLLGENGGRGGEAEACAENRASVESCHRLARCSIRLRISRRVSFGARSVGIADKSGRRSRTSSTCTSVVSPWAFIT